MINEPVADCIFCDSIRAEVGGKSSYMGVYCGEVVLPSIPTLLPTFAIVVSVQTPTSKPISELSIVIDVFGSERTVSCSPEEIQAAMEKADKYGASKNANTLKYVVQGEISPLVVKEPGVLTVAILADDKRVGYEEIRFLVEESPDTERPKLLSVSAPKRARRKKASAKSHA